MLNFTQRSHVWDSIPDTFDGVDAAIPKYREETTLQDVPDMPYMAIAFRSEGVSLGYNKTAGPSKTYRVKMGVDDDGNDIMVSVNEYSEWLKGTVHINIVSDDPELVEKAGSGLAWSVRPGRFLKPFLPFRVKFGEMLSSEPIVFGFKHPKSGKNAYVATVDFSVYYQTWWVDDSGDYIDSVELKLDTPSRLVFMAECAANYTPNLSMRFAWILWHFSIQHPW